MDPNHYNIRGPHLKSYMPAAELISGSSSTVLEPRKTGINCHKLWLMLIVWTVSRQHLTQIHHIYGIAKQFASHPSFQVQVQYMLNRSIDQFSHKDMHRKYGNLRMADDERFCHVAGIFLTWLHFTSHHLFIINVSLIFTTFSLA
jgi:hypothetical protein